MIRRLLVAALMLLGVLGAAPSFAASTPDPCVSLSFKNSAAINISSATTTAVVTLNANHSIFVCSFAFSIAGSATSAATAALEYGTGSNCAAGVQALTGTFGSNDAAVSTTPTVINMGNGGATLAIVPPGSGLCVVTTGTNVFVQGIVTYVYGSGSSYP